MMSCATDIVSIEERKWYLMEIEGDKDIVVLNDKAPYLEFDLESNKIGGNATCNNFFTDYMLDGENITFGTIATTLMDCNEETKQEYRFLQALERTESYKIIDNLLYLYEGKNSVLIFTTEN
jgi:heat shock protein HslJ